MNNPKSLTSLAELLHRALKAQSHYAQDHPQAVQTVEAVHACLAGILEQVSPLILTCSRNKLWCQGRFIEGSPNATHSLVKEMESRGMGGLVFHAGLDTDELQLLFFALQLRPQRLQEMGGADSLFPGGSSLRALRLEAPTEEPPSDTPLPLTVGGGLAPEHVPPRTTSSSTGSIPIIPLDEVWSGTFPLEVNPAPMPEAPFIAPTAPPSLPEPADEPPSPAALAADLRALFGAVVQMTSVPLKPTVNSPWAAEQREVLKECGFLQPDFSSVSGTGTQLGLGRMDPVTLRDALRGALSDLDAMTQGHILLGLPTFPSEEQALRRALDYLGPELLATAVAEVHLRLAPSRFTLALLVASLLQCVKDRDLSLEAIRGRLQFEGWTIQDVDALKDAILWECHGTDTKLRMSLMDRGVFELDAHQVTTLLRQLVRGKRGEGLEDLLNQLQAGFASPEVRRRRLASEIVADLAECLDEPALTAENILSLSRTLHEHIIQESDPQSGLWSCQSMEALLGHWLRKSNFEGVYREMLALGELALTKSGTPEWKAQAVRDLLFRIASPDNMLTLTDLLHHHGTQISRGQLHSLLALLGRPAAQHLAMCLEMEEEAGIRINLIDALRAIGRNAVPALKEALASPNPSHVRNALLLLGEIGHKPAFPDVALALEHRDLPVRRAAVAAVAVLGEGSQAAQALSAALGRSEPGLQLEILAVLSELKDPVSVFAVAELLQNAKSSTEESARIRLRALETLGLIGSPAAIPPLQDIFRKKGILGGRESTATRLAAAKSLAAINTREAKEAIALAMDGEPHEEVRAVLRQYLVDGHA
jgi:HEAT repeat protein